MITREDVEFYKENGYLLVKGVFNQQEVEEMRQAVEEIIIRAAEAKADRNDQWRGDFLPPDELKKLVLKGFHDVHYHDAAFMRAVIHPNMAAVLQQIIDLTQLHHSKMLVKPPENGAAFLCIRITRTSRMRNIRCLRRACIWIMRMRRMAACALFQARTAQAACRTWVNII